MGLFRQRHRIGPVEVATARDRKTNTDGFLAACTKDNCGWSATYATQQAADLAAEGHRCTLR